MYIENKSLFEATAKSWVENYASDVTDENKIKSLMEMGFDKDQCEDALEMYEGDSNRALDFLLGNVQGSAELIQKMYERKLKA